LQLRKAKKPLRRLFSRAAFDFLAHDALEQGASVHSLALLQAEAVAGMKAACSTARPSRTCPMTPSRLVLCVTHARAAFRDPAQIWPACSSSFDLAAPERLAGLLNAGFAQGIP
jgi:hypothetical protein